jgi:dipeptidyl aminopeptidase/acylaminoacyl peptidase
LALAEGYQLLADTFPDNSTFTFLQPTIYLAMKKLITFILISTTVLTFAQRIEKGNLVTENIPDIPSSLIEKMNQYQNIRSASFLDFSPDGKKILMSTRFGEVSQIHLIDHPGGVRKQMTFFKEPVSGATFFPSAERDAFVFAKDSGGNEFAQLYSYDLNTGDYKMISDGGRTQNSLPKWSNKGDQFTTVSTRRNKIDYDIYLCSQKNPSAYEPLLSEGGSWGVIDWSPDDQQLIVRHGISATKSYLYILDIKTKKLTPIERDTTVETDFGDAKWSADGKGIYLVHDIGTEFGQLHYYNIESGKSQTLTGAIPWDVGGIAINKKRDQMVFSVNENGYSKLFLLDTRSGKYSELKNIPIGIVSGFKFHHTKNEIAITISTAQSPGDIFTYDLGAQKLTQWTFSEVGGLNTDVFTMPELIEFETFDKTADGKTRKIPAFYYKPKNHTGKLPVVINIHGGPESQTRPSFSSFNSFLNNELGVAVIAPNVRGSSGYGKSYLKMDNGYLREESVKDIGALIEWIATQPDLDASRICVYGGSYGGYMTLASLTHYSDKLKCGIDVVGISNFVTFLKNTESYRRDLRRVEYGDETDPKMNAFLEAISPTNNVEKITKPLFIIQGLNDPRVPASEAEQMKNKLQERGKKVWYLLAKDEGHGFKKKPNIDYMQWAIIMFLKENLLP